MTAALFLKDLRLFRPIVWGAIGLAAVFWVIVPGVRLAVWAAKQQPSNPGATGSSFTVPSPVDKFAQFVSEGSEMTWLAALVSAAAMGGMALAAERRSRSAEFLAMLPVARRQWVGTKLAAITLLLGLMVLANLGVTTSADFWYSQRLPVFPTNQDGLLGLLTRPALVYVVLFFVVSLGFRRFVPWVRWGLSFVVVAVLCGNLSVASEFRFWYALQPKFYGPAELVWWYLSYLQVLRVFATVVPAMVALAGVAWLVSSMTRSSSLAAAASVAIVVAVVFPVYTTTYAVEFSRDQQTAMLVRLVVGEVLAGLAAIAVGVVIQLKRQSP